MPKQKIPTKTPIYQNIDEMALNQFNASLLDGYMDEEGNTHRRPGLTLLNNLGTGAKIDGLYWWKKQGYIIAVSGGRIFKKTTLAAVPTEITGATLVSGTRPMFTEDGTYAFMANGGPITHYNNAGVTVAMVDPQAPTVVTHLGFHDQYLLCNNVGTGQMHYSDVGNSLSWQALSFVTIESDPDYLIALNIAWREILCLGKESTEVWWDDGSTPFSRLEGAYTERGCGAPYSLCFFNNTWYWLDHTRRLVKLEARTPQVVSTPFDKVIQGFSTISDALGDLCEIDGRTFYVLTFPTAERTFVYDYALKLWYEWCWWSDKTGLYYRWHANCICYARDWNKWLVGSRVDGKIYTMSTSVYTDEGDTIRTLRRTGHVDYETMTRKRSNSVDIRIKRGIGLPTGDPDEVTGTDGLIYTCILDHTSTVVDKPITGSNWAFYWKLTGLTGGVWIEDVSYSANIPYIVVRWRDNNANTWGNEHQINLGKIGETEFIAKLKRLGIYKTRQWEFILSDAVPLILCDAEETIEVLE